MRRVWLIPVFLVGFTLTGGTAHASPSCESEAIRIAFTHPRIWKQAGSPRVVCGEVPGTNRVEVYGTYDYPTNTIYIRGDHNGVNRMVAHELGHAWFFHRHDPKRAIKYAFIRGFANPYATETWEDYAEVFALTLGEWAEMRTPPPYGFQNTAGPLLLSQVYALRDARLLPRTS